MNFLLSFRNSSKRFDSTICLDKFYNGLSQYIRGYAVVSVLNSTKWTCYAALHRCPGALCCRQQQRA